MGAWKKVKRLMMKMGLVQVRAGDLPGLAENTQECMYGHVTACRHACTTCTMGFASCTMGPGRSAARSSRPASSSSAWQTGAPACREEGPTTAPPGRSTRSPPSPSPFPSPPSPPPPRPGSGKTTVVHALAREPVEEVVPTVGFSISRFKLGKVKLVVMVRGGGRRVHMRCVCVVVCVVAV
jgi:hypothetical protein